MTITSSSSPMIHVLTGPATRSILACIPFPAFPARAYLPQLPDSNPDHGPDRVDDELDGDRRQQQPGDPGQQFDAAGPQQPHDDPGKAHGQPERSDDCDNSGSERRG